MTRPASPPIVTVQSFKKDHPPGIQICLKCILIFLTWKFISLIGKLDSCSSKIIPSTIFTSHLIGKQVCDNIKPNEDDEDEESHNSEESGVSDPTDVSDSDNHIESSSSSNNGSTSPIFSDICSGIS